MSAFQGATNTTVNGGTFTAVSNIVANVSIQNATDIVTLLFSRSATAGLLDAAERFDAPKCDEDTRISMLRGMKNFVQNGDSSSSPALYWLHGPAGVGKSALAQSLSLSLNREGDLAASFFFSRTSPGRNNGNQLIVTLAYQLAINIPPLQHFMSKAVKENPAILTSSNAAQMQSLIIDPINQWQKGYRGSVRGWARKILKMDKKLRPRLILVDGLDECSDPDVQRDLILCIGSAILQLSLPFRFVIASRPESHILSTFELDSAFQGLDGVKVTKKNLGDDEDADEQITTFLLNQFAEIRMTHPIRKLLPQPWPLPCQMAELVSKSSKGFIYPATVIRYIKMPHSRPDECLERILGLSAIPNRDKPYEPLDRLYRHIFESVPEVNKESIRDILHFLVIPHAMSDCITPRIIERYFNFKPGHVEHVLHDLLCIVAFNTCDEPITVLHASLPDFLLDRSRSGSLCIDIGDAHATVAATILQALPPGCRLEATVFGKFLDHLMQANMTDGLHQVLNEFDLVEEYRNACETIYKASGGGWVRRKDMPSDRFLQCITFLLVYLMVLSIKTSHIITDIHALEAYIVKRYPLAAALQTIDDEILKVIIPALRDCAVIPIKSIETNLEFEAFDTIEHPWRWRLYLLLMTPSFISLTAYQRLAILDVTTLQTMVPVDRYSQIARTFLSFLMSGPGTQPSFSMSNSRYSNLKGIELATKLAIQIIAIALAQSTYSASLFVHLTKYLGEIRRNRRIHGDTLLDSSLQQLAPVIITHCIRVQSEASVLLNQPKFKKLDDLVTQVHSLLMTVGEVR